VDARGQQLATGDPGTIHDRCRFLAYSDDSFDEQLATHVVTRKAVHEYERNRLWRSLPDSKAAADLRENHAAGIAALCRTLAMTEKKLYDRRARTFKDVHPLGIQVHLDTGVANGLLVVRSVRQCADVLRRVVTNDLQFELDDNKQHGMWYLKEKVSGSVYRVVSQDRKLTNCFWNFYRKQ
jgi:hypothetical protein